MSQSFWCSCSTQGYQGSCGCNYHHDCRQPQLRFSVSVPNPERGTKELPAAERMSTPFWALSHLPLASLSPQRLAHPLRLPFPGGRRPGCSGFRFSLSMTYHRRKVVPRLIGLGEAMFCSLVLSLRPEGKLYHWLNVGHRRKGRKKAPGRQAMTSIIFNKGSARCTSGCSQPIL